jgi:acetyl-CoA carboxylase carboxyltransferase component
VRDLADGLDERERTVLWRHYGLAPGEGTVIAARIPIPASQEARVLRDQYEQQGHPLYSTARLWDDGIIDPRDTLRVLALALAACANAPLDDLGDGVFRM